MICLLGIVVSVGVQAFAQKPDSSIHSIRSKKIVNTPQIKGSVPTYKPRSSGSFLPYNEVIANSKTTYSAPSKSEKILTVVKVYPNPVEDQVNLVVRIDRETNFSVKIVDLLGNEVVTLANEKISAGEQTKTYTIPNRLNSGIYFLRINSAGENVVKRISVL